MSKTIQNGFITVGKNDPTADFNTADYPSATQAIVAASTKGRKILLLSSDEPITEYLLNGRINLTDNFWLEGEDATVKIKMINNVNQSVFQNAYTTKLVDNVNLHNLIIDQNGANQIAGGGLVCIGMKNFTGTNLIFEKSFRFQLLLLHLAPALNQTGTITVTENSLNLTGVGTQFLSTLKFNSIIKVPSGQFARVATIISDTLLELTDLWLFPTESTVSYKVIEANSNINLTNCTFKGTLDPAAADNIGLGFGDDSTFINCKSFNSGFGAGCGFVPDHADNVRFINCEAAYNANSGFSFETSSNCKVYGGSAHSNISNGINLISGSRNNTFSGMTAYKNGVDGTTVSFNNTTYGNPDNNIFHGCHVFDNGGVGMRVSGAHRTTLSNNYIYNNGTISNNQSSIVINQSNSRIPDTTTIINNFTYDSRDTKRHSYAINIASGTNTKVINLESNASDFLIGLVNNLGTGTTIISQRNGRMGINTLNPQTDFQTNNLITAETNAANSISPRIGTQKGQVIQQTTTQTANLSEWQSTAGNVLTAISSGGLVRGVVATSSAPSFSYNIDGSTGLYRVGGQLGTQRISASAIDRVEISPFATRFLGKNAIQFQNIESIGNVNYVIKSDDQQIILNNITATRTFTMPDARPNVLSNIILTNAGSGYGASLTNIPTTLTNIAGAVVTANSNSAGNITSFNIITNGVATLSGAIGITIGGTGTGATAVTKIGIGAGQVIQITDTSGLLSSSINLIIDTVSAQTINGLSTVTLKNPYQNIYLKSNGVGWIIDSNNQNIDVSNTITDIGAVSATPTANGGAVTSGVLNLAVANSTLAGLVSTSAQNIGGQKSFLSATTFFGQGATSTSLPFIVLGDLNSATNVFVEARSTSLTNVNLSLRPKGNGTVTAGVGTVISTNLALVQQSSVNTNATLVDVNALVAAATPIYTVTAGRKLVINAVIIRVVGTPTGTNTVPPSFSIGNNSTAFNNFMIDTAMNGTALLSDGTFRFTPSGAGFTFPSNSVINVRVNTAATGNTALSYTFELLGIER